MSHLLACNGADLFAASAPVSMGNGTRPCEPSRPISVVMARGTRDNVFAVQGDGPAGLRAAVAHADIQPGAFDRVSEALGQQAMAQAPVVNTVDEPVRARAV